MHADPTIHIYFSAFMVWSRIERRRIAGDHPNMPNTEISKLLATEWRQMSEVEKSSFIQEAKLIGQHHREQHPDYKYSRTSHPKAVAGLNGLRRRRGGGGRRRMVIAGSVAEALQSGNVRLLGVSKSATQLPSLVSLTAGSKLVCQLCAGSASPVVTYANSDELEAHLAGEHLNCLPYECERCKYSKFPTEYSVRRHVEEVHQTVEYKVWVFFTRPLSSLFRDTIPDHLPH